MGRFRAKGFTLVELLIVVILIAVLASIAVPKVGDRWRFASEYRWKAQLNLRRNAIERFHSDTGLWPAAFGDVTLGSAPATGLDDSGASVAISAGSWKGPYLMTRVSNNETVLHPRVRLGWSYKTTPPGVGNLRLNTNKQALDGTNIGAW